MSVAFRRIFEHLLPRSRAWNITPDTELRRFFLALEELPSDARDFLDQIWRDAQPSTTTQLDLWEDQFGLPDTGLSDADRRTRLDAAWSALGGQSISYLQGVMQANGFDVYFHEWWTTAPAVTVGVAPIARDPNTYLAGAPGYPLVNKIATSQTIFQGAGDPLMEAGEPTALAGQDAGITFGEVAYVVPANPLLWPYFLYVGAASFPSAASVDATRQEEFENLLLKLCPGHLWLGVIVNYV